MVCDDINVKLLKKYVLSSFFRKSNEKNPATTEFRQLEFKNDKACE